MNLVKIYTRAACLVTCLVLLFCAQAAHGQCDARFLYEIHYPEIEFRNLSSAQVNCFWSFGDGQTSTQREPRHRYQNPGEYIVTLNISYQNASCSDTYIDTICLRCVFPGDANNDGIVNNNDVLYLGLAYGEIGPVRLRDHNGDVPWRHSNGPNNFPHSGVNIQHGDCDNSGVIDEDDLIPIRTNYNRTIGKGGIAECLDVNDIPLYFVVPDSIEVNPEWELPTQVSVEVHLGTNDIPADNVYGIAFSVNYDNELIKDSSLYFDYSNSQFGAESTLLYIDTTMEASNRIETAVTGTDHVDKTIIGQIGTINFVMEENLAQKSDFITAIMNLSFADITLIRTDETTVAVCPFLDSAVVFQKLLSSGGTQPENKISIYPNPASDYLKINFSAGAQYELTVTNVLGKEIMRDNSAGSDYVLNTSTFSKGIYFLTLRDGGSSQTFKFEVSK